jgi:hypothetical protein
MQISPALVELLDAIKRPSFNGHFESQLPLPSNLSFLALDSAGGSSALSDIDDPPESFHQDDPHFEVAGCERPSTNARPGLDLSGTWKPIVSTAFLESYGLFLQACGESYWMRKLLVNAVSMQTQKVHQYDNGERLEIVDIHPLARWNRTIVASKIEYSIFHVHHEEHINKMIDPQGDELQIVANWCGNGTIHRSVLKTNKSRLQDAWLETRRYLEKVGPLPEGDETSRGKLSAGGRGSINEYILVCESIFHPLPHHSKLRPASIVWKYERI